MTLFLNTRADITLDAVRRVAWLGEEVTVGEAGMARIAEVRAAFLAYIANDPEASVYGVNRGQGEMIHQTMDGPDMERLARLKPLAAAVPFGEPYPERVTRAMVLARFANILEGHAAATPRLAARLAGMLNGGTIPPVSRHGQGGAGEILALYTLFAGLSQELDLEAAERGALINGSPGASALVADAALMAEGRLAVAFEVMALAIEAFNAPLEHYDPVLGALLGGGPHDRAFAGLAALVGERGDLPQRPYQGPVSYRIIPSVLAQACRALENAQEVATASLAAATHNPVYLMPDADHRWGRCLSTGGYHNALAAPAMDDIAAASADLCLLCVRLVAGLLNGHVSGYPDFLLTGRQVGESDGHGAVGYLPMAAVGFAEEARHAAQRTFIPGADASVFGQDDVAAPAFLAWPRVVAAGRCQDAALAVLAAAASQALFVTGRTRVGSALQPVLDAVRGIVAPVTADRVLGPELEALALHFCTRAMGDAA